METLEKLCREMGQNRHIMTFSQIGESAVRGAAVGIKSGVPGGVVIGATLAVCVEAGQRVALIAHDLNNDAKHVPKNVPKNVPKLRPET